MQFMNSSLEKLLINLADNDLKEEFGSENSELLKQKVAYPYEYMGSFTRFRKEKLPDKEYFYSSQIADRTTDDNGEKLNGHISDEDYLSAKKFGMNLT